MTTGEFATASFASMLEATSREAGSEVGDGVRRLRRIVKGHIERPAQLPLYIYVAVRQLYRTYLTLSWEVGHLGSLDASLSIALSRLGRAQLVQRVHRTGGDFALIGRICQALHPHIDEDPRVAEAEEVLLSWTDREAHLFCMLVPLANYADELRKELTQLSRAQVTVAAGLAARLKQAERAMTPVLRELAQTTQVLHQLAEELKPLTTTAPPAHSPSSSSKEAAVLLELQTTLLKGAREAPKETTT